MKKGNLRSRLEKYIPNIVKKNDVQLRCVLRFTISSGIDNTTN
jgi:hypothetical protein